jgi:hydrogenase maturation protease
LTLSSSRCLILACGNTLRSDDGIGPHLAAWAEEKFRDNAAVRVISRQQWTPDLAADIAQAESVLFLDCSLESTPGSVALHTVAPAAAQHALATHHIGASELLALTREFYNSLPRRAMLLTVGAGSIELGEVMSDAVLASLPQARELLDRTIRAWLQLLGYFR